MQIEYKQAVKNVNFKLSQTPIEPVLKPESADKAPADLTEDDWYFPQHHYLRRPGTVGAFVNNLYAFKCDEVLGKAQT